MSWYFELAGTDKATLTSAVQEEIAKVKAEHRGHEVVVEKLGEAISFALERQRPVEGYAYRVKSNGHVDAASADGTFEIRRIKIV